MLKALEENGFTTVNRSETNTTFGLLTEKDGHRAITALVCNANDGIEFINMFLNTDDADDAFAKYVWLSSEYVGKYGEPDFVYDHRTSPVEDKMYAYNAGITLQNDNFEFLRVWEIDGYRITIMVPGSYKNVSVGYRRLNGE